MHACTGIRALCGPRAPLSHVYHTWPPKHMHADYSLVIVLHEARNLPAVDPETQSCTV